MRISIYFEYIILLLYYIILYIIILDRIRNKRTYKMGVKPSINHIGVSKNNIFMPERLFLLPFNIILGLIVYDLVKNETWYS